jgi:methylated-DNA-[protein]-cysteine S-methyltransferase
MGLTADDTGVYARFAEQLDRAVEVGTASGRAVAVSFPETVPADAGEHGEILDRLFDYLDGAADDFRDVTVALTVPTDQRAVLEATRNVPYGETVSAERVARTAAGIDADDEDDRQTVRAALRENPTPILVPDHRVRGVTGATPPPVGRVLRDIEGIDQY